MKFLTTIMKEARKSDHPTAKHATIVVRGGAPLSIGYNHDGRHSESVAMLKMRNDTRGTVVINLRIRRDGRIGMSRPCPDCCELLRRKGVRKVHYTNASGEWEVMRP